MDNIFKAALFDLDGVVFDTEPQYTHFWGIQCREFHPEIPGLEKRVKGQTLTQIYDQYFSGNLTHAQDIITKRLNAFEQDMTFEYVLGFENVINELKNHNVKTAVVTSSNIQKMQAVYAKHDEFKGLFDAILTAEDFERSKPDPDCYQKAAMKFGVNAGECIVFEDSFNGLKSGQSANMRVVGLTTTNPEEVIKPYSDMTISDYSNINYEKCLILLNN